VGILIVPQAILYSTLNQTLSLLSVIEERK